MIPSTDLNTLLKDCSEYLAAINKKNGVAIATYLLENCEIVKVAETINIQATHEKMKMSSFLLSKIFFTEHPIKSIPIASIVLDIKTVYTLI